MKLEGRKIKEIGECLVVQAAGQQLTQCPVNWGTLKRFEGGDNPGEG